MKTVGIIAEYNPFHNGHKYLTDTAKAITGADTVISIMSGNFVQRGAPAVCNKYLRTEMALKSGQDIIFELPTLYSLGSAEVFASGAVKLFCALNSVDYLCFGSECGDLNLLSECASAIDEYTKTEEFKAKLSSLIKSGIPYSSAFSSAVKERLGVKTDILSSPNNLLAVEYLRALNTAKKSGKYNHIPKPITIKRSGAAYSDTELSDMPSATAIRSFLINGNFNAEAGNNALGNSVPACISDMFLNSYGKSIPISEDDFSDILYLKINSLSDDGLLSIPDINTDLLHKPINLKGKKIQITDLIANLKSKCFTYSGISRSLFKIVLEPFYSAAFFNSQERVPYIRLLGFRKTASDFLRNIRGSETCSVITKPSDGDLSDPSYALDIYAANLYEQICSNKYKTGFSEELKTGPVML